MIPHRLSDEPSYFTEKVQKPGLKWLTENPDWQTKPPRRPRNYWKVCLPDLADAFQELCAYTAMHIPSGTVDHYLSCTNHHDEIYKWSNYRYAINWINSSKNNIDTEILDPFEVGEDWFEIHLPSLILQTTPQIPKEYKEKAEYTLVRLHLDRGTHVMRQRRKWYKLFQSGKASLDVIAVVVPLLAKAIRKQQELKAQDFETDG